MKFLSHFKGRFVVEKGRRSKQMQIAAAQAAAADGGDAVDAKAPSLFEIRSTMGKLTRRAMSAECDATSLNSNFPFVLKVSEYIYILLCCFFLFACCCCCRVFVIIPVFNCGSVV